MIKLGARVAEGAKERSWGPSSYTIRMAFLNREVVLKLNGDFYIYGWIVPLAKLDAVKKFLSKEGVTDYTIYRKK